MAATNSQVANHAATDDIPPMNRRQFLATALGFAVARPVFSRAAPPTPLLASDRVPLGSTGITASRLALGTGSNGWNGRSNQSGGLGLDGVADLFEEAFDLGINFWDTADQYGTHPHIREGLKRVPREKVVILTKTHAESASEMKADLDRFRREIGVDTIDILLLHCKTAADWPQQCAGAMDVLADARSKGIIRAHGISCHSLVALETASRSAWVQIDLARINPFGAVMDAPVEKVLPVLQRMHNANKGVIGMKVFGAGRLADKKKECLRYVLAQPCVPAFSIGFESRAQMHETINLINHLGSQPTA
jgi:aryl-alcohol dehydrogenase-like predicted oxidoreductase